MPESFIKGPASPAENAEEDTSEEECDEGVEEEGEEAEEGATADDDEGNAAALSDGEEERPGKGEEGNAEDEDQGRKALEAEYEAVADEYAIMMQAVDVCVDSDRSTDVEGVLGRIREGILAQVTEAGASKGGVTAAMLGGVWPELAVSLGASTKDVLAALKSLQTRYEQQEIDMTARLNAAKLEVLRLTGENATLKALHVIETPVDVVLRHAAEAYQDQQEAVDALAGRMTPLSGPHMDRVRQAADVAWVQQQLANGLQASLREELYLDNQRLQSQIRKMLDPDHRIPPKAYQPKVISPKFASMADKMEMQMRDRLRRKARQAENAVDIGDQTIPLQPFASSLRLRHMPPPPVAGPDRDRRYH